MLYTHGLHKNRGYQERKEGRGCANGGNARACFSWEECSEDYLAKWNIWVKEKSVGKRAVVPFSDPDKALTELLELMAPRCIVHNYQQWILSSHQLFAQDIHRFWELLICRIA